MLLLILIVDVLVWCYVWLVVVMLGIACLWFFYLDTWSCLFEVGFVWLR